MVLPKDGTFVVLSIDAVASLERLEDEVVTESCRTMSKKYVAYADVVRFLGFIVDRLTD